MNFDAWVYACTIYVHARINVCMYACMYVSVFMYSAVCMYVYAFVSVRMYVRICVRICRCPWMWMYTHACECVYMNDVSLYACTHACRILLNG